MSGSSGTGPTMVWVDGDIRPAAQSSVAALDHGVTVGDGVFETLKVVDGTPFALRRHLARLRRSLAVLDLDLAITDDSLRQAVADTVGHATGAGTVVGRLRITVTGGSGPLGSGREPETPTVVIAAAPGRAWGPTSAVATVDWVRNERSAIAGAKTTSYAENVVALAAAHRLGADEAIFANTVGALCEGSGSNVFLARDGELCTPGLATGCLAGVTRGLVLETVAVTETDALTLDDLRHADEAFLTSSTRDVHPIVTVDGVALRAGVDGPGPLTRAAAAAFAALQARTLDP